MRVLSYPAKDRTIGQKSLAGSSDTRFYVNLSRRPKTVFKGAHQTYKDYNLGLQIDDTVTKWTTIVRIPYSLVRATVICSTSSVFSLLILSKYTVFTPMLKNLLITI